MANKDEPKTCGGCGVSEGSLHDIGCGSERCPFCSGQLSSCDCCYEKLGFEHFSISDPRSYKPFSGDPHRPYFGLPRDIYENGLTDDLAEIWDDILDRRGRIPYIDWPLFCRYCGVLWPDMFRVEDEEWRTLIQPDMRRFMVCKPCYNHIKKVTEEHNGTKTEAGTGGEQEA